MSIRSSEENYKIAKSIYQDIDDNFYEIENEEFPDEEFLIDQTLEDIKKLNRHVNRINIDELEQKYSEDVINVIENNVDTFREASYHIERALTSMKFFDKLHPVLDQYMKHVNWKSIADSWDNALKKFGRFLTKEENYEHYKNIINNIIRGTMSKKAFQKLFDSVSSRIAKPKKPRKKQRQPLPPEMWPEEEKEKWKKYKEKVKAKAMKHEQPESSQEFDVMGEGFVSLNKYKKILEYYDHSNEDEYWEGAYDRLAQKEFGLYYDELSPSEKQRIDNEMEKLLG